MKKLNLLFTALLLLCTTMATAHDFEVNGIYYKITSSAKKTVEVTYKGSSYNEYSNEYTGDVVIPESVTYNGNTYSVTSIGSPTFYNCSGLTSVKISNSVTSIGAGAFSGCSGLTSIEIPNGVTSIENYVFEYCSGLTSIEIPNSVTSIGNEAFNGCSSLINVIVGNSVTSIKDDAFYGCNIKKVIWLTNTPPKGYENLSASINYVANDQYTLFSNVTIYPYLSSLFEVDGVKYVPVSPSERTCDAIDCSYSTSAENLTIGNTVLYKGVKMTVKDIKPYICYGNKFIKNIAINHNANIPIYSFSNCTSLTSVIVGNSVTSIGDEAFYGCSGLTSITIGNSVTSIGNKAFNVCTSLKDLRIEDGEGTLSLGYNDYYSSSTGKGLFYDCPLETLYLGRDLSYNTTKSYGYSSFNRIKTLTSVTIGNSVTSIGSEVFGSCSGLTSVVIPNSVTSIGGSAFYGCTRLTSIVIPNSVTSIGGSAFYKCSGLTSVVIGNSVTSIGNYAFGVCTSLKDLRIEDGEGTLSLGYNGSNTGFFYDCPLETVYLGRNLSYSSDGSPFDSPFYKKTELESVTIGNSVTSIGNNTFYNCSNLTNVIIGNSVKSIGNNAFYNCFSLTSVAIPNRVTKISNNTFYNCSSLTSVIIGNSVKNIGDYAFYGCEGLTSIEIPNSVTSIGGYAFTGCSALKNVVIPNSVTSIGNYAFNSCRNLTEIVLPNSVTFLGINSFAGCRSLGSVSIGTGIKAINNYAFLGCSSLTEINIPSNVKTIGDYVFDDCKSLAYVTIADRETELNLGSNGSKAMFSDCPLNEVYIGGKIVYNKSSSKGYSPFYRNTSLRTVVITDNEIEIYDNEFYGCTNLKDVKIGDGVYKIGNWAFSGCSSLDYFAFGKNVQSIGTEAFSDCNNVTRILTSALTPPTCGTQALDDINKWNCTLYIPSEAKSAYLAAEQWREFFFIEDLPLGINDVIADEDNSNAPTVYYDLQGRVVENPTNGIYIIDGKKVFVK